MLCAALVRGLFLFRVGGRGLDCLERGSASLPRCWPDDGAEDDAGGPAMLCYCVMVSQWVEES